MTGADSLVAGSAASHPLGNHQYSLFTQLVRLADDHLILGHRLSEWCGHAPMLEEDLALPNIALDLLGQARGLYHYAGVLEGIHRDEDTLAYLRHENEYTNLLMCERSNGDFAHTMLRQLFFSVFMKHYWQAAITCIDHSVSAIAGKAKKEADYHVKHSAQWVIRLGDGTEESARRLSDALNTLSPFLSEMFECDETTQDCVQRYSLPHPATVQSAWRTEVSHVLRLAKLSLPDPLQLNKIARTGGRQGQHSKQMAALLNDLQFMQKNFPSMQW